MTRATVVRAVPHAALQVIAVVLVFAAGASPAAALNVVTVTTTVDVVNPADGFVSLREAFTTANTDADDTQIILAANALYSLCGGLPGTDEDANANGDLDHTDTRVLTIAGNGAKTQAQCPGERVIHNVSVDGTLVLNGLEVSGGTLSAGQHGSGIWSLGNLTLANVVVTDNTGSAAVVLGDDGFSNPARTLTIAAGQIVDNGATGVRINHNGTGTINGTDVSLNAGSGIVPNFGSVNVLNSTINDNGSHGVGGIDAGLVTVADSIVEHNGGWGLRNTGNTPSGGFLLSVTNTQVRENGSGGVECSFCNELVIEQSRIADNLGPGAAFLTLSTTATATITKSTIENNVSPDSGGGIRLAVEPGSGPITPIATIVASTIVGNEAGGGGGLASNGVIVQIARSTITENSAASGGGLHVANADLTLTYATIVRNYSPHVANVFRGVNSFVSFGSVIALGQGGGWDCLPGIPTTSLGYNFDGDGTCMFGAGAGDQSSAGNPMMGPLSSYGGPTRTILPVAGGPLPDKIPVSEPQATGLDQRDVLRPQGSASDIGSVEIVPPMVVADTAEANKNARIRIPVLENDIDPDNKFDPDTLSVVAGPIHGSVSLKRGGELFYKPDKRFAGLDTMIYEVCPRRGSEFGTGCPRALVSVCVAGPCTTR